MSDPDSSSSKPPSLLKRLSLLLRPDRENASIHESLEEAIEESDRETPSLNVDEREMLTNLLAFGETKVADVMVPRADIVAAEESIAFSDLLALFRDAQHSRLPIYRDTLDEPIGLVHIKDLVTLMTQQGDGSFRLGDTTMASLMRPVLFVPSSMPVMELLQKMQASHTHLAMVIDEYGGTDGLVSIEDLIEEIVGDISDEHDEETRQVRALQGGAWLADGRVDLEDFKTETGVALDLEDEAEVETLGGLAVALLGRVPQKGEIVAHPAGYELEVLNADPRRVKLLRVRPAEVTPPQAGL